MLVKRDSTVVVIRAIVFGRAIFSPAGGGGADRMNLRDPPPAPYPPLTDTDVHSLPPSPPTPTSRINSIEKCLTLKQIVLMLYRVTRARAVIQSFWFFDGR